MNEEETKVLKAHYRALTGIKEAVQTRESVTRGFIERGVVEVLQQEIDTLVKRNLVDLPKLDYSRHRISDGYNSISMLAYLDVILSRLSVLLDGIDNSSPVRYREFCYIKDNRLKKIVERDYLELQRCLVHQCWKATIILTGGCVEAILTDALLKLEDKAKALPGMPKDKQGAVREIYEWGFVHLIGAATKLGVLNPGVEKLSHYLRDYRDLVHPSVEVRSKLKANEEEANIAVTILDMINRDLLKVTNEEPD